MKVIDQVYINGSFVAPHGSEVMELINPTDNTVFGKVTLGDREDAVRAIESAQQAFKTFSRSSIQERMDYLQRLHDAVLKRVDDLRDATILEYGAPVQRAEWSNRLGADTFLLFKQVLQDFSFERMTGNSKVILEPLGVTAILTAWNANTGSICVKLAPAIAAGCTVVIKPSEISALQTQILTECFHEAGLPAGIINVLNGRGDIVGDELSKNRGIAKIAFTGSTQIGKLIAHNAIDTMKRMTLELSGKSPNIILDDADFSTAIPMAVNACFMNNGQACIAASRLFIPKARLAEAKQLLKATADKFVVGNPADPATNVGPLVNRKQYDRIQQYIQAGIDEGAEVLTGGTGHPEGLNAGNFVRPTIFVNATQDMKIVREEIFGPVLSVLTYETEEEAIEMANDTIYGLQAYISSADTARANNVASRIAAGRVLINSMNHDPLAPFGGFKESGMGREGGVFGLEAFLEPKAIIS